MVHIPISSEQMSVFRRGRKLGKEEENEIPLYCVFLIIVGLSAVASMTPPPP